MKNKAFKSLPMWLPWRTSQVTTGNCWWDLIFLKLTCCCSGSLNKTIKPLRIPFTSRSLTSSNREDASSVSFPNPKLNCNCQSTRASTPTVPPSLTTKDSHMTVTIPWLCKIQQKTCFCNTDPKLNLNSSSGFMKQILQIECFLGQFTVYLWETWQKLEQRMPLPQNLPLCSALQIWNRPQTRYSDFL